MSISLTRILDLVGKLDDAPGDDTPRERFLESNGIPVSRTHLYYTSEDSGSPFVSFDADQRAIDRIIASFDQVVARIEQRDFAIAERPYKHCIDCDMRFYCDRKNWTFRGSS